MRLLSISSLFFGPLKYRGCSAVYRNTHGPQSMKYKECDHTLKLKHTLIMQHTEKLEGQIYYNNNLIYLYRAFHTENEHHMQYIGCRLFYVISHFV